MNVLFRCPGCRRKLRAAAAQAPRSIACSACKKKLILPGRPLLPERASSRMPEREVRFVASGPMRKPASAAAPPAAKSNAARTPRPVAPLSAASSSSSPRQWFSAGLGSGLAAGLIAGFLFGSTGLPKREVEGLRQRPRIALPRAAHPTVLAAPVARLAAEEAELPKVELKASNPVIQPAATAEPVSPKSKEPFGNEVYLLPYSPPFEGEKKKVPDTAATPKEPALEAARSEAPLAPEPAAVDESIRETVSQAKEAARAKNPTPALPSTGALPERSSVPDSAAPLSAPKPERTAQAAAPQLSVDASAPAEPQRKVGAKASSAVLHTARDIEARVINRYRGEDSKLSITLVLTNSRGEQRSSQLVRYRQKTGAGVASILSYVGPADVKGTATLTVEQKGGDDLQWLYLPALKKIRRIAAADKGKSWAGTDWSYEDLQEKKLDDYQYSDLGTEVLDGHACHRYHMTPKTPGQSAYGRIEYWVRKDILELVQGRYYDKRDRLFKELRIKGLRKVLDAKGLREIWTPHHMEMINVMEKHASLFLVDREIYNAGLPENLFTPRALECVPEHFEGDAKLSQAANTDVDRRVAGTTRLLATEK